MTADRLAGKTAIVTGGTRGIGRAISERFAAEGARVYFTGRDEALGAEVSDKTGATFVRADATDEADTERLFERAMSEAGRIDILVNNAGIPGPSGRVEALSIADFDATLATNVRAAFLHLQRAAPVMRAQKSGAIINLGSIAGHRAGAKSLAYSLSKAAIIHMTRCAAMELGEDGVRVNSISPGMIVTGIHARVLGIEGEKAERLTDLLPEHFSRLQALPVAGMPGHIADAALWLASDEAAFVNGEDIVIDGGLIWGRRFSNALDYPDATGGQP